MESGTITNEPTTGQTQPEAMRKKSLKKLELDVLDAGANIRHDRNANAVGPQIGRDNIA